MTILASSWENRLLAWAYEALRSHIPSAVETDDSVLQAAYDQCDAITRHHSKTFYLASGLLPAEKRQATRALYAFCRITDDIVDADRSSSLRQAELFDWEQRITAPPATDDLVALAWADARARFRIPHAYAQQLIDGCARDLQQVQYETFTDLAEYAYGVASTVGLMAMHIVGFAGEAALPYAVKLGVALQITNILRDVGEDWRNGRVYLPQDELAAFGLRNEDIAAGRVTGAWRQFMRFQLARNRLLYAESQPGIALLDPDGRLAIAAAAELYGGILDDIEAHDYDVFNRRASLSLTGKLARLPGIWWRSKRLSAPPVEQDILVTL